MRRVMPVLFSIAVFLLVFAGTHYDGKKFEWGYEFRNTDSTRLRTAAVTTTLYAADSTGDTLFTPAIDMNPDEITGTWTIRAIIDSSQMASDSIDLAVRFGNRFDATRIAWGPWKNIWVDMRSDSLYEKYIAQKDSTWFLNATMRQYRLIKRDSMVEGDSASTPYVTDFMH